MLPTPEFPPDWSRIDTAFLDMDGTLLDLRFDNYFWQELVPQRYAEHRGMSTADAQRELRPRFAAWEGRLEWYCLDHWARELDMDLAALKHEVAARIAFLPDAREFLESLRPLRRRVVLVTNSHRTALALKLERTGLDAYLDHCYSSHDFGLPKEDRAFWERLREIDGFDPQRTLLVDDSLPVLRAARAAGLHHLYAIRRPDTGAPARTRDEFCGVDSLLELLSDATPR